VRLHGRAFDMRYDRHVDHVRHAHHEKIPIFALSSQLKEVAAGSSLRDFHLPLQRQRATRAAGPGVVRLRGQVVRCGGGSFPLYRSTG